MWSTYNALNNTQLRVTDQATARCVSDGDRETAVGAVEYLLGRVLREKQENIGGLWGY